MKNIILTGDRPTGRLHLGHYVGSLKRRVELQNSGRFDEITRRINGGQNGAADRRRLHALALEVLRGSLPDASAGPAQAARGAGAAGARRANWRT